MSNIQNTHPTAMNTLTKTVAPINAGGDGQCTKRLRNELMQLMMSSTPGISAFPAEDSNLLNWVGTITGADGTVYADLSFKISLKFPANYPYTAPTIKFDTPCYHPNVDMSGNICLDILKEKWSAVYNVQTILISLQSLLGEPNNASPLNAEAAGLWSNQTEFKKMMLKHHQKP